MGYEHNETPIHSDAPFDQDLMGEPGAVHTDVYHHHSDLNQENHLDLADAAPKEWKEVAYKIEYVGGFNQSFDVSRRKTVNKVKNHCQPKSVKLGKCEKKRFACDMCQKSYPRKYTLKYHMITQHLPTQKKFKCGKCNSSFAESNRLIKHQKENAVCNICGMIFCLRGQLLAHKESVHETGDNERIVEFAECKLDGCNDMVASNEWAAHMASKHAQFSCDVCGKKYRYKHQIRRHILDTHCALNKEFKCEVATCNFSTVSDRILKSHRSKHFRAKERNFMCNECGARFAQKVQMKNHMFIHIGFKPLTCPFDGCPKRFRHISQRIEHIRTHTGEKPFVCLVEGCDRRFAYRIDLKRHKFSAHGIYTKKFPCELCSEIFPENMLLKKHMRKHENNF